MREVVLFALPIITAAIAWYVQKVRHASKFEKLRGTLDQELLKILDAVKQKAGEVEQRVSEVTEHFRDEATKLSKGYDEKVKDIKGDRDVFVNLLKELSNKEGRIIGEKLVCVCRKAKGPKTISIGGAHRAQRYVMEGYPATADVKKEWKGK